jgi:hypothetical protein
MGMIDSPYNVIARNEAIQSKKATNNKMAINMKKENIIV